MYIVNRLLCQSWHVHSCLESSKALCVFCPVVWTPCINKLGFESESVCCNHRLIITLFRHPLVIFAVVYAIAQSWSTTVGGRVRINSPCHNRLNFDDNEEAACREEGVQRQLELLRELSKICGRDTQAGGDCSSES